MRVSVSPARLEVTPGVPSQLEITITNPGTIIGGYTVRVLGVDPSWVELSDDEVSLFPDETRTFTAFLTIPVGLVAGERRMAVQLREATPPFATAVEEVVLVVPAAPNLQVRVDPVVVTSGTRGRFSLLVDNTGNTPLVGHLVADDAEAKLAYEFDPPTVDLAPGEHRIIDMQVKGKRPTMGAPLVRLINLRVLDGAPPPPAPKPPRDLTLATLAGKKKKDGAAAAPAAAAPDVPLVGNATFIQKARLTRGALSLVGLLVAITVFALVITLSLSRLAGQSAADRDLALKIAAAQDEAAAGPGTAGITGKVVTATDTTKPAKAVEVSLYAADDLNEPLSKAVSDGKGTYSFGKLPAGDYKLYYQGAGLQKQWYPQALSPDDAAAVTVEAAVVTAADVPLGGTPATIEGKVVGADVTDATMTLRSLIVVAGGGESYDAEVQSVAVAPDGSFALGNVPSPSTYNLEVTKQGYATATQQVEVKPGEAVDGIRIALVAGNGSIRGSVVGNDGNQVPGTATVTLTSDTTSIATVTDGSGNYLLDHLPTPATYTLTVSAVGYTTQTQSLTVGDGQSLDGVAVSLVNSSGTLSGRTFLATDEGEQAVGGVTVTVSDGEKVVQTASVSPPATAAGTATDQAATAEKLGSWKVTGLTLPGIYNVTFSRTGLVSQTISISLEVSDTVDSASLGVVVDDDGIHSVLRSATAEISGLVTQTGTEDPDTGIFPGIGEVEVTLTSGLASYKVITSSAGDAGVYHIAGIVPGTYTISFARSGVRPQSEIIALAPGESATYDPVLEEGAAFRVRVRETVAGATTVPATGRFYVAVYRAGDYDTVLYREGTIVDGGSVFFDNVDAPENYVVEVSRSKLSAPLGSKRVQVLASERDGTVIVTIDEND